MARKPPRSVEEDMISEVGHANGNPPDIAYYRVTISAKGHDKYRAENVYADYSFVSPGMTDESRMKRALYYFDLALFREGVHRHRLITSTYNVADRTGAMYKCMVDAYIAFAAVVLKYDDGASIFVTGLERTTDSVVLRPIAPPVHRLLVCPEPYPFELVACTVCLRVEEPIKGQACGCIDHVCSACKARAPMPTIAEDDDKKRSSQTP